MTTHLAKMIFVGAGIPFDGEHLRFHLLSDGLGSYARFAEVYGNEAKTHDIVKGDRAEDAASLHDILRSRWCAMGIPELDNGNYTSYESAAFGNMNETYAFMDEMRDAGIECEWVVEKPEKFVEYWRDTERATGGAVCRDAGGMLDVLMHDERLHAFSMTKALSRLLEAGDEAYGIVMGLLGYDTDVFEEIVTCKKPVIVIGRWTRDEENLENEILKMLEKLSRAGEDISDMKLFYKGHPATPTEAGSWKEEMFRRLGITDIKTSAPLEPFLISNPHVRVVGYRSTVMDSISDDRILGVFGE